MKTSLFTYPQAAEWGLLIADVMNAYQAGDPHIMCRQPLPGSRLAASWQIHGCLVANDAFGVSDANSWRFYGVLAQQVETSEYAVVLRGTANIQEWIDSLKCCLISHPAPEAGKVEEGFFRLYQSMRYLPLRQDGNGLLSNIPDTAPSAASGIYDAVGGHHLVITGHSLGAALGTYLAFDLADRYYSNQPQAATLSMCLFASPRPGNKGFADRFEGLMADCYLVYNYARDIVPHLPPSLFDYCSLTEVVELTPQTAKAVIAADIACNHHILCYCAMLDYNCIANWHLLLARTGDNNSCICGSNMVKNRSLLPAVSDRGCHPG